MVVGVVVWAMRKPKCAGQAEYFDPVTGRERRNIRDVSTAGRRCGIGLSADNQK